MSNLIVSQFPPDEADADSPLPLVRGLGLAAHYARYFAESVPKDILFTALMDFLIEPCAPQQTLISRRRMYMGYVGTHTTVLCCEAGIALLTRRGLQYNVNHMVNKNADCALGMHMKVIGFLTGSFSEYAVSFEPVERQLVVHPAEALNRPRRFVPSSSRAKELQYDADAACVTLFDHTVSIERVLDASEVRHYRPLGTCKYSDSPVQVYWHKFPCGTIVALQNPALPFYTAVPLFDNLPGVAMLRNALGGNVTASILVEAVDPDAKIEHALKALALPGLPVKTRATLLKIAYVRFGIKDELLQTAYTSMTSSKEDHQAAHALANAGYEHDQLMLRLFLGLGCLLHAHKKLSLRSIASDLADASEHVPDMYMDSWHTWILTSPFVLACVDRFDVATLQRLMNRCPTVRLTLVILLRQRIGEWTRDDVQKAALLRDVPCKVEEDPLSVVQGELRRLDLSHEREMQRLVTEEENVKGLPPSRMEKKAARVKSSTDAQSSATPPVEEDVCVSTPTTRTHDDRCARLQGWLGMPCELIGTGIFFDAHDMDVVVTADPRGTLADAYAEVRARTGWAPQYAEVDGTHVAVLSGTFEGVKVDAQVWRGTAATSAETETERALLLTRRLLRGVDELRRRCVHCLHRLFEAGGLKGSPTCCLPGVAVTCMALVASCRMREDVSDRALSKLLLSAVRDLLSTVSPTVDLDSMASLERTRRARPRTPLRVVVSERHLSMRVTTCTTRHLLDAVSFAVCGDGWSLNAAAYDAWRDASMVVAARVRPKTPQAVSMTLHVAVHTLDGHPLVDTLHVTERHDDLLVYVTLDAEADVRRYGFKSSDVVEVSDSTHFVTVCASGGRRWPLAYAPSTAFAGAYATATECASVRDVLRVVDGVCVPNAPSLSIDVFTCFDRRHWTWLS